MHADEVSHMILFCHNYVFILLSRSTYAEAAPGHCSQITNKTKRYSRFSGTCITYNNYLPVARQSREIQYFHSDGAKYPSPQFQHDHVEWKKALFSVAIEKEPGFSMRNYHFLITFLEHCDDREHGKTTITIMATHDTFEGS